MKKIVLATLLLISSLSYSQRFKEILKFQIETRAGGIVYGITENQAEAEYILLDFQERNKNTKYDISGFRPVYKYSMHPVKNANENPVENFKAIAGKNYKVLSAEDIIAIDTMKKEGIDAGIDYYVNARNSDPKLAKKRLNHIYSNLNNFRIKTNNYLAQNTNYIN